MAEERPTLELMGAPGSPYTRKMLALMRYRHIPYRFERQNPFGRDQGDRHTKVRPAAKVPLLPTYYFRNDDGEEIAVTDSTPLIRRFEKDYGGRHVIPSDPALAYLDMLIEDYGDEWLTKAMFHYRWHYDADIKKAGDILPRWRAVNIPEDEARKMSDFVIGRQVPRLSYVGSNETTKPVIEESFKRFIHLLDGHLTTMPFLMGERPGASDFAIYGQLTCLALFDPTPQKIIAGETPRVYAWVEIMEELSGYLVSDEDWLDADAVPETLTAILKEIGRIYVPYLKANAKAVLSGAEKLEMTLDGQPWEQAPFTYQAKCLKALREAHAALGEGDRARVDKALAGTGCEALFED